MYDCLNLRFCRGTAWQASCRWSLKGCRHPACDASRLRKGEGQDRSPLRLSTGPSSSSWRQRLLLVERLPQQAAAAGPFGEAATGAECEL